MTLTTGDIIAARIEGILNFCEQNYDGNVFNGSKEIYFYEKVKEIINEEKSK